MPAINDARATAEYHLSWLGKHLSTFEPPNAPFDPKGVWELRYELWVSPHWGRAGKRLLPMAGRGTLQVSTQRLAVSGYHYFTNLKTNCAGDALSSARDWVAYERVAKTAADPAYMNSGLRKKVTIKGDSLRLEVGGKQHRLEIEGGVVPKWNLFHTVQQLPGKETKPLSFTLVDENDLPLKGHRLAFLTEGAFEIAGTSMAMTVYVQTGPGRAPATYWVDEHGRLLLFISGVEMALLSQANGEAVRLEIDRRG